MILHHMFIQLASGNKPHPTTVTQTRHSFLVRFRMLLQSLVIFESLSADVAAEESLADVFLLVDGETVLAGEAAAADPARDLAGHAAVPQRLVAAAHVAADEGLDAVRALVGPLPRVGPQVDPPQVGLSEPFVTDLTPEGLGASMCVHV